MEIIKLGDRRPPSYEFFLCFDEKTGEHFKNYLVFSPFNKWYVAGKPFTHWIKE